MSDRWFLAIICAAVLGWIAVLWLATDHRPFRWVGLPPGASCGYETDGIRTCVGDGRIFVCATDWRERLVQCAVEVRR